MKGARYNLCGIAALFGLSALTGSLSACVESPGQREMVLFDDFDGFVTRVQPILDRSCANPSCHGNVERPLEIFSVHQHRIQADEIFMDTPLSERELWRNFERVCSFLVDFDDPAECALLEKPLAIEAGGGAHVGGTQFFDESNQDYQELLSWITEGLGDE